MGIPPGVGREPDASRRPIVDADQLRPEDRHVPVMRDRVVDL
ncbi:16S rRNA (cytosine(1402)-N(4))-methyltransferase, partial [Micrococcus endophyticus]